MSITYWTLRCQQCGEQIVAERPDSEFTCRRCGTTQHGVTARRGRRMEQVTTGTDEFLRNKGGYLGYQGLSAALTGALARIIRRESDRQIGSLAQDGHRGGAVVVQSTMHRTAISVP